MRTFSLAMARKAAKSRKKTSRKKKGAKARPSRQPARKAKKAGALKTAEAKPARRRRKIVDPQVVKALKQYEEAILHFNRNAYRKARELFAKVEAGVSPELAERARVHATMCDQRLEAESQTRFRSADEHYDYAVAQINAGNLEEARVHLKKAVKMDAKAGHVHYALATVSALSGQPEQAMEHLEEAIALRPENRFQARHDGDFESLLGDLGFQQLVFPERFPSASQT